MTDLVSLPEDAEDVEAIARRVAREEIASLAGLVLRRTVTAEDDEPAATRLASIFAEALNDFSSAGGEPGK